MTPQADPHRLRAWLRHGGVIAYATESCFGLGCDPRNRTAVMRILTLKQRPPGRGLILIGSDVAQFRRFLAPLPASLAARLSEWWPGPTTLLLDRSARCPRWLSGHHDKLAVRVTAHPDAARLCRGLGMALVSTSANRHGRVPCTSLRACRRNFGKHVWLLAGRVGRRRRPSTILDPRSGKVLRT